MYCSEKKTEDLEKKIANYEVQLTDLNALVLSKEKKIEELTQIKKEYDMLLETHEKCNEIKISFELLNEGHIKLVADHESYVFFNVLFFFLIKLNLIFY